MPVLSMPEDKPKLMFYAAMMWMQNFGFFLMYFMMYTAIPEPEGGGGECTNLRFWVGFFALDCFVESFVCVWMAMGGYTDDGCLFPVMWILHLLVALPYVLCTFTIPHAIYSDDGKACRALAGAPLYPLVPVYWTHATLFSVYVWMMLSVTYYSFVKPTFFPYTKVPAISGNSPRDMGLEPFNP
eukprot:CAMPEP_0115102664 /NCGR_PEP_ID=MMETSP0227-20121206/34055_1 /TAXON_ID=89957 /ORGANISM="Polarella glacialis, Strain CCMP 1383" /LENGTH=183 /DNA_ID=CAMNT_0002498835 /DNA_START=35 /DNA_END=586 /DNA_ORIENTATION=+